MGLKFWTKRSTKSRANNENSMANLIPGNKSGLIKPDNAPIQAVKQETAKLDAMADMAASFGKMAKAVHQIEGGMMGADEAGAAAEIAGTDFGGLADVLETDVAKLLITVAAPYIPGLIQKYLKVEPVEIAPVNVAPPNPSEGIPPSDVSTGATAKGATAKIKTALALPDFLWTEQNVKEQLAPFWPGVNDLTAEDLKRLGQKLSKVK